MNKFNNLFVRNTKMALEAHIDQFSQEIPDEQIKAVGALVVNNMGYILAFARGGNESKLGLVAGVREPGEELGNAMRREVEEETGIVLSAEEVSSEPFFVRAPINPEDGYCATYVIKYDGFGPFPLANMDDEGKPEGYAFWIEPTEFIKSGKSAFLKYNTELLQKAAEAGLIQLSTDVT